MTIIDRLYLALDAGDDSVLPILADALEEVEDTRAAGLRRILDVPAGSPVYGYYWTALDQSRGSVVGVHPTLSAAYLALAAALN